MKRNATIDFVENMFMCAAKYDNIEVLEWLKRNKCPWDSHTFFFCSSTWQYKSFGMVKKE